MTAIAEKLDAKFADWKPDTTSEVERMVNEIIDLADSDALDILPARSVVQEVTGYRR